MDKLLLRRILQVPSSIAMFKMNYGKMHVNTACPFCLVEPDSQSHSLQCHEVRQKIDIEGDYMDIFMDDIHCDIIITIQKISKIREEIFD